MAGRTDGGGTLERLRRLGGPPLSRLAQIYRRFANGMTVGVRGLVLTGDSQVFLIRHSYIDGWHLPGGGVEPGETVHEALARELSEEGNIDLTGPAALHAVYLNRRLSRRDHVAMFVVRAFRQEHMPKPNAEIIAHGFFPCDALPPGTSPSSRRRVAEVVYGEAVSAEW